MTRICWADYHRAHSSVEKELQKCSWLNTNLCIHRVKLHTAHQKNSYSEVFISQFIPRAHTELCTHQPERRDLVDYSKKAPLSDEANAAPKWRLLQICCNKTWKLICKQLNCLPEQRNKVQLTLGGFRGGFLTLRWSLQDLSSLTRVPTMRWLSLHPWTSREFPKSNFLENDKTKSSIQ